MFDVFRKELTVIRKGNGKYENGLWIEEEHDYMFPIYASVQGNDAEVLETLPEGYRTGESYTLFTSTRLHTASPERTKPDIVMIEGENFQIIKVTPWQHFDNTSHYEVVVVKENADED